MRVIDRCHWVLQGPTTSCPVCGRTYPNRRALHAHLSTAHGLNKFRSRCPVCDKDFSRKDVMLKHLRTNHEQASHTLQRQGVLPQSSTSFPFPSGTMNSQQQRPGFRPSAGSNGPQVSSEHSSPAMGFPTTLTGSSGSQEDSANSLSRDQGGQYTPE